MNFFDSHCHLNFERLTKRIDKVVQKAHDAQVAQMVVPGTDITSSEQAISLANQFSGIYAAVGIHPHHAFHYVAENGDLEGDIHKLEVLSSHAGVVAIGEIGLDRHLYEDTKYENYHLDEAFMDVQRILFSRQLELAKRVKKAVIIHNREAKEELLSQLHSSWDESYRNQMVFHCCEPDDELLQFAIQHEIYIGVDGDVSYVPEKQEFVKQIPIDRLVLETDSPFLLPEPLKSERKYPNVPAHVVIVAQHVAELKGMRIEELAEFTTRNANILFGLPT